MNHSYQSKRSIGYYTIGMGAVLAVVGLIGSSTIQSQASPKLNSSELVGSWRAKVQFLDGPYSSIKDLEFMYLFHSDGTMLESSNYDAAPPVPPAYGIWRPIGEHKFEAKYEFYPTRYPDTSEHLPEGTGWLPGGRGVLVDTISVASDGQTFSSRTHLTMYNTGDSVVDVSRADGHGSRMKF